MNKHIKLIALFAAIGIAGSAHAQLLGGGGGRGSVGGILGGGGSLNGMGSLSHTGSLFNERRALPAMPAAWTTFMC